MMIERHGGIFVLIDKNRMPCGCGCGCGWSSARKQPETARSPSGANCTAPKLRSTGMLKETGEFKQPQLQVASRVSKLAEAGGGRAPRWALTGGGTGGGGPTIAWSLFHRR